MTQKSSAQLGKKHKFRHGELKAAVVRLADGTRTQADIARATGASRASVNAAVQRLQLHSLIVRKKRASIVEIENRLANAMALVEDAYCEGFAAGYDGGWIGGNYKTPWKASETRAALAKIGATHG